ncbi:condensin-2 complex subunit D3 [Anopheles ziemanni]|uniref:condensin-2 complex subunit D3 n=1 Tax=Anopheles coustani TaxID=139045 RepID=UPI00265B3FA1|nr:condensin-2 complex subunit D3 [Anopheles coustani]XP_058170189.1 condensin-2 complex subunit D3 [Anopheles ziemanni]
MAPPHVHMLLDQLPTYFDSSTSIELVDHLCNKLKESGKAQGVSALVRSNNESDDEENSNESHQQTVSGRNFMDMPMIQKSTQAPDLLDLMHDIIREVENLRIRAGIFDQYDNWQYLTKKLDMDQFLAFIYGLVSLAEYDPTKVTHRRLALSAARLYIVLLSTPGQKQTIAFNEYVLSKTFDVFQVIRQLRDPKYSEKFNVRAFSTAEENRLLLDYIPLLDDVQLLLRCMTLKNCESTKIQMIKSMTSLITFCAKHAWNRVEAEQLVDKIYSTMSVMCLPEHDAHDNCSTNISMILNKTAVLYTVEFKCAPEAFQVYNFFIRLLEQYPKDTAEVLTNFIKSVLTNTPKVFQRPDSFAYLLDIAVKYELAIFSKCNVSIVDYLKAIETNVESSTRINIIELVSRLATVDCIVDWELFQSEISKVPREIEMIRILYNKLLEKSNTVKQKAFQCLLRMLQNGNKIIKEIFHSAFYRPNADEDEINYLILNDVEELYQTAELELGISRNVLKFKKQSTNNTTSNKVANTSRTLQVPIAAASHIEGLEIINDILKLLPNIIHEATLSPMSAIRRVALSCLECILELDRNRIDDPVFESIIIKLAKDPVMLMRRTTLNVLNKLIGLYPNYLPLIKLWSKCLLFFMDDVDQKLKESAMESLKTNVFDNMCRFEDSSTGKIFTPWMIVRAILVLGKINVLKAAVESWIQKSILTPTNLSIIESHIFTVNCSEAWIILSIIACKMKSRNPDVVIKTMCDILQQDTYNSPICLQYILSVIKSWLTDFTRAGLNHLFKILSDLLRTGSTNISLVSDIYSLCCMIKEKSDGTVSENWITSIRDSSAEYLLHYHSHYASMHMTNERYLISLLVYTESSTDLNDKPDQNILNILQKYLSLIASNEKLLSMQTDQNRKINVTIIVLARFGLRDGAVASTVVADFNKILLFKNINESIICTLITAFSDLCKRHTSLVDSSIKTVIGQLSSSYLTVRSVALNNLNELILQDYVKMRGGVLLNILKLIIDEDEQIAAQALYVIQQYVHSKNENMLKVSLLECVYAFNNYLQYAERDMFPASEFSCETCDLAGSSEDSLRKRCAIYDFFAENIDDSSLLKLLKNVNKIHHQLSKGKYVECSQGVATLLDLLYVFTMMCKAYERDKLKMSKIGNTRNEEDTIEHQEDGPSASKKLKTAQAQIDKEIATTTEKMIAIYYSFQQEVLNYIQKVEPDKTEAANHRLNEFATAIARNFRSLVEFAKPMNFWRALMKATDDKQDLKQNSSKRKDLKRGLNTEINNLGSDEEEYMQDANDIGIEILHDI